MNTAVIPFTPAPPGRFSADSPEEREALVREAARRIVDHYKPLRVYLFGSQARGEARLDSDLDFLVVLADDAPRRNIFDGGVRFSGLPITVDVIPVTETWYRDHANCWASLAGIVEEEGKLVFEAAA